MQAGALAGEDGAFLVTPHETDIDLKSQCLGRCDDPATNWKSLDRHTTHATLGAPLASRQVLQ